MNKLMYCYTVAVVTTLAITVLLGSLNANWFIPFGIFLVFVSTAVTVTLGAKSSLKARAAERINFEDYLPKWNNGKSYTFRYTSNIFGINQKDPLAKVFRDIEEIRRVIDGDKDRSERLHQMSQARIDSCLAQIQYHNEVTLPRIMAQGVGYSILAAILALWGSLYLAIPSETYMRAKVIAKTIAGWLA